MAPALRATPERQTLAAFARQIAALAPYDGSFKLAVPGVFAVRRSKVMGQPLATYEPSLCIVAQGAKIAMLGRKIFRYDPAHMLVFSVDLPLAGQVIRASRPEPLLAIRLALDAVRIAELSRKVFPGGIARLGGVRCIDSTRATEALVSASVRLLQASTRPADATLIVPMVIDEILIRLLQGPLGGRIAQIGRADSSVQRVARAIACIRANVTETMRIETLAKLAHMSASGFHHHFKMMTTMSPLQYQKSLRLQEARRLMLMEDLDAISAAHRVGYLSASQFSREYARMFESPPVRDISRLRQEFSVTP
jgi:AraC-like DNA-binding protein